MANKSKKTEVKENIEAKLSRYFGCTPKNASKDQMYKAVSMTVKDILTQKRGDFKQEVNAKGAKKQPDDGLPQGAHSEYVPKYYG